MTTISLKLPELLLRDVEAEARRRGLSKSALIRDSLESALRRDRSRKVATCLDLMGKAVGSFRGPKDFSTNRRYLIEAISSGARRKPKNHR